MCNKCKIIHSNLCQNHKIFNLEKNIDGLFTGFCKEKNHNAELEYFCKNHNQLCCAFCITKIKNKENGKHNECNICIIEDIKDTKKNKLIENIKLLEELSLTLENSIQNLKNLVEKINENKEQLIINIQKIFTKFRNELNNREDELLSEVNKIYEDNFFKDDIIKASEKLPNKVKLSLEKGKNIREQNNNGDDKFLSSIINDCIYIENNIKEINLMNENIQKSNNWNLFEILFSPEEEGINTFLNNVKTFGKVICSEKNKIKSSIIKDDIEKQNLIINWIKEKINKNIIEFDLIFKMNENGSKSDDFHKYCDNKGPTLVLLKTTKQKIFGGFTPLNWKVGSGYLKDKSNQTFIFSINLKKKFDMINSTKNAICTNYGPWFGDCDFGLKSDMKKGETYANKSCNFLSNSNLELTNGKGENENFETEELEVYKVKYELNN